MQQKNIKTITDLQRIGAGNTPAPTPIYSDDGWAKFERIIGGINQMLETVIKMREDNQGQADPRLTPYHGRQVLTEDNRGAINPPPNVPQGKPIIPPELSNFIEIHIGNCIKENPEMPFSEVIDKIPITAQMLGVLIVNLKGANDGNKR